MIGAPRSEGALKRVRTQSLEPVYDAAGRERSQYHEMCWGRIAAGSHVRPGVKLRVAAYDRQRLRHEIALSSGLCTVDQTSCGGFVNTSPFSALRFCSARLDLPSTSKAERARKTNRPSTILRFASWSGHPRPSSPRSGPLALGRRCAGRYRPIRHVITYAQVFVRACRSPHASVRFTGLSRHAHVLCVRHSRGFACASV